MNEETVQTANRAWTRYLPPPLRSRIEGRQQLQQAIGNIGWLSAEKLLRLAIGLFVNVWIARYLGPSQFGLLSYAIAFAGLFVPLVTLGLDEIVVRNVVVEPECANETLGTTFLLKLAGGATAFVAASLSVILLRRDDTVSQLLVCVIASASFFHSLYVLDIWFNSQVQSKYAVLARNTAFVICSALRVALIVSRAPLFAFAVAISIEAAIVSAGLAIAYLKRGGSFRLWRGSWARARHLLKDSWPLILSFISIGIYQRIDQVMLQQMTGSTEVGVYSVAVRLTEVWSFIPNAIYWSVFPGIVAARQVSDEFFHERLQKLYNLVVLLAYAVAIPTALLSQLLVDTLFGDAYARAGQMVAWLVWAHVFTSMEIARCVFLTTMNWNRIYFVSVFLGCIFNVALCYLLIPRYGGMGAVYASIFAYWFAAHGSCFLFKATRRTGVMLSRAMIYPKVW